MVIVLAIQEAVTPAGKPVAIAIPVAPVVVWLIGVKDVLIHNIGVLYAVETVLFGFTTTGTVIWVAFVQPLVVAGRVSK